MNIDNMGDIFVTGTLYVVYLWDYERSEVDSIWTDIRSATKRAIDVNRGLIENRHGLKYIQYEVHQIPMNTSDGELVECRDVTEYLNKQRIQSKEPK